jgi:hypothetical protein
MKKARHIYRLTKMVLSALATRGLEPVLAQRGVCSQAHRIGTAADILAYEKEGKRLVVVELKCGHDHGKQAAAVKNGKPCKMATPLASASDCVLHRHFAQLAATREMLVREKATMKRLGELGLDSEVGSMLVYVNDAGAEFFELSEWWKKRGGKILEAL